MTRNDFISQQNKGVTDFSGVDLRGVDFSFLYLVRLNFKGANLSGCSFRFTSFINCNFENADLSGANMHRPTLYKVNLTNAKLDNASFNFNPLASWEEIEIDTNTMNTYFPLACPSEGEFIGWKKANHEVYDNVPVIVKLLIPKDARRSSAFGRKCRCDKARVLGIECLYEPGNNYGGIARSIANRNFKYEIGKEVSVDNFDDDRSHECAPGIHFFMTREEAVAY